MKTKAALGLQGSNLDLDEAIALGVQYFLLLAPEGIIGGDLQRLIDLCEAAGYYARFIIRFYSPDRMGQIASEVARADYAWMLANTTSEWRAHIVAVIPANELNLACEHQDGKVYGDYWSTYNGYRTIDGWLVSWAEVWKQMAATHGWKPEIWWPALAPGHQPAQGVANWYPSAIFSTDKDGPPPESEYELLRTSMAAYDAIGIHVYGPIADEWTGSGRLARIVDKLQLLGFGNKPMHVTEVNQVNFAQFLAFASVVGIEISIWFLWVSAAEDHRPWNLRGSPYIAGLKEYIAEEGETPMPVNPMVEDWLTDMWHRSGVEPNKVNDAMWKYCLDLAKRGSRAIVPQPSPDGNYQNHSHDRYVVGYTMPVPLYMDRSDWVVHEGFPPLV